MTAVSYPLAEENFTPAQWRGVFDGQHGIIGASGAADTCLDLVLSAVDNTATVKKGKFWFKGFVLEITVNHGLTLAAAVGTAKTYSIGVMYDPALEDSAPLSIYAGLTTDVAGDTPSGGAFITLYEITRQVSQILSQAAVVDQRTWLGPHLNQPSGTAPATASIGTRLWLNGEDLLRVRNNTFTGAVWQSLSDPPWTALTLVTSGSNKTQASVVLTSTTVPAVRERYGKVEFRGEVEKNPNTNGFPSNVSFKIGTIPTDSLKPAATVVGSVPCEQGSFFNTVRISANAAGDVSIYVPDGATSLPHWISLRGFEYERKVS